MGILLSIQPVGRYMGKEDAIWNTHSNINEWIRFSDTKAALILGIYGAVGIFALPGLIDHIDLIKKYEVLAAVLAIGTALSIISVLSSMLSLAPALSVGKPKKKDSSLIYFKAISDNFDDPTKYFKAVDEKLADDSEVMRQVSQQVWANSKVAARKYWAVKWSMWFLAGSIVSGVVFVTTSLLLSSAS